MILVYDPEGRFVRTVGEIDGEGLFERPTSIAIDQKAGRLYVLDSERYTLFVLDLEGHVLARVGSVDATGFNKRTASNELGQFENPQALLIHDDELIVLDATRVQIFDLMGKFQEEFEISNCTDLSEDPPPGLFMDSANRIYVSDPGGGTVQVYSHEGRFLRAFGRPGVRMGEFDAPTGMWADSSGRVYIVDARRIQVFQLSVPK
jgi:DNA-binding beta-propeller fold protein YncE